MIYMVLKGHLSKEIEREIRRCIIEEGLTDTQCLDRLGESYELDKSDKDEIKDIIGYYKNL